MKLRLAGGLRMLAGILWLTSLFLTAAEIPAGSRTPAGPVSGALAFFYGFMGFFPLLMMLLEDPLGSFSLLLKWLPWLANPLLLIALIAASLRTRSIPALTLCVVSVVLMVVFAFTAEFPGMGKDFSSVEVELRAGYFIWVMSGLALTVAVLTQVMANKSEASPN